MDARYDGAALTFFCGGGDRKSFPRNIICGDG